MRTAIAVAVAAALLSGTAVAQDEAWLSTSSYRPVKTLFVANWEFSFPVGSFRDYIDETSFRGISFEDRSFVKPNVSVGVQFNWNRFSQTFDNVTVPITNGSASGPVYRHTDMFGIRGIAHYYFGHAPTLRPYLGVGIGGMWAYSYQQIADLANEQDNFNFVVDPEIGILYWFATGGTNAGLNIAFRYTYTTATTGRQHDAQFLSGVVGLAFGY